MLSHELQINGFRIKHGWIFHNQCLLTSSYLRFPQFGAFEVPPFVYVSGSPFDHGYAPICVSDVILPKLNGVESFHSNEVLLGMIRDNPIHIDLTLADMDDGRLMRL